MSASSCGKNTSDYLKSLIDQAAFDFYLSDLKSLGQEEMKYANNVNWTPITSPHEHCKLKRSDECFMLFPWIGLKAYC